MKITDNQLFSLIWGLLFLILALPAFAGESASIHMVLNDQDKVTESFPVKTLRM